MSALRIGLIGFGDASRVFHAPLIRAVPGLELAAVASSDARKVHAALGDAMPVGTTAWLIARADIDVVVVAAPNALHHPIAKAALEPGRHVVVDKPFSVPWPRHGNSWRWRVRASGCPASFTTAAGTATS